MSDRPTSERDGECICDYNPSTTDGPQEECPFHGRPYSYWIDRGDALATRLAAVEALANKIDNHAYTPECMADACRECLTAWAIREAMGTDAEETTDV